MFYLGLLNTYLVKRHNDLIFLEDVEFLHSSIKPLVTRLHIKFASGKKLLLSGTINFQSSNQLYVTHHIQQLLRFYQTELIQESKEKKLYSFILQGKELFQKSFIQFPCVQCSLCAWCFQVQQNFNFKSSFIYFKIFDKLHTFYTRKQS